jgi:hypothetical protein
MEKTRESWERVKALFERALAQEPSDRKAFLARVCPEADLREQVAEIWRDARGAAKDRKNLGNSQRQEKL